jgi:hypothetical protein
MLAFVLLDRGLNLSGVENMYRFGPSFLNTYNFAVLDPESGSDSSR